MPLTNLRVEKAKPKEELGHQHVAVKRAGAGPGGRVEPQGDEDRGPLDDDDKARLRRAFEHHQKRTRQGVVR